MNFKPLQDPMEVAKAKAEDEMVRDSGKTHWKGCWKEHPECAAEAEALNGPVFSIVGFTRESAPDKYGITWKNMGHEIITHGVKLPTENEVDDYLYDPKPY